MHIFAPVQVRFVILVKVTPFSLQTWANLWIHIVGCLFDFCSRAQLPDNFWYKITKIAIMSGDQTSQDQTRMEIKCPEIKWEWISNVWRSNENGDQMSGDQTSIKYQMSPDWISGDQTPGD